VGICDKSHTVKSRAIKTFDFQIKIDVPCQILLTGTPMHHTVGDWVVQTESLLIQVADQDEIDNHGPCPLDSVVAETKYNNIMMEEAYTQIKDIVWPWTIRR